MINETLKDLLSSIFFSVGSVLLFVLLIQDYTTFDTIGKIFFILLTGSLVIAVIVTFMDIIQLWKTLRSDNMNINFINENLQALYDEYKGYITQDLLLELLREEMQSFDMISHNKQVVIERGNQPDLIEPWNLQVVSIIPMNRLSWGITSPYAKVKLSDHSKNALQIGLVDLLFEIIDINNIDTINTLLTCYKMYNEWSPERFVNKLLAREDLSDEVELWLRLQ